MSEIDISLVIPAYNEQENIIPLLNRIEELLNHPDAARLLFEIILVDDGSSDGTCRIAEQEAQKRPGMPLKLVPLEQNGGQTRAFMAGFSTARGRLIATLDADLQNDPLDLLLLLQKIKDCDCVAGYRKNRQDVLWKKLLSRISNRIRRLCIEDGISDSGCSLKLFRKECLKGVPFFKGAHRLFPAFFAISGYAIGEQEVSHNPRQYGCSKYSFFSRGLSVLFDFLATAWLFHRRCATFNIKK